MHEGSLSDLMKRPTQTDVALLAGVSRAAVSYVINNRANGPISITEDTRQKIRQAAQQLGYQPDAAAQSLRLRSSRTIGVLIPDMLNPHYWDMVRGVEEQVYSHQFDLLLMSTSLKEDRERTALRTLLRRRVDGLILGLTFIDQENEEMETLVHRRSPMVLLGGDRCDADSVIPDDGNGARQLLSHLLELGHRRIGLVFGVAHRAMGSTRLSAYKQMLKEAAPDLPQEDYIEMCGPRLEDGYQAALRLLDRRPRPTAIMVINDLLAIGALHAAAERGLRVPQDVSITGFDDIEQAAYLNPALTTVQMNAWEMGRTAARLLFERMDQPEHSPAHILAPTCLIKRASTGPVPVGSKN